MGGYGSGQTAWRNQGTVEGGHPLDVLALRREHGFGPTAVAVRLPYADKVGADAEQHVGITWTACRFGGFRPWFECPDCGRRVVKLYREYRSVGEFSEWRLGRAFCRHCLRLVYRSQRESPRGRRLLRAFRIAGADRPRGHVRCWLRPRTTEAEGHALAHLRSASGRTATGRVRFDALTLRKRAQTCANGACFPGRCGRPTRAWSIRCAREHQPMAVVPKVIAGSLVLGLIAVAAAIYFSASPQLPSASSYTGYEPVLHEWFALSRYKVARIKHLAGPFYAIRYRSRAHAGKQYCLMVDVSKEYKGGAGDFDGFWQTRGYFGFAGKQEEGICDF
jgi:hypothetical protein